MIFDNSLKIFMKNKNKLRVSSDALKKLASSSIAKRLHLARRDANEIVKQLHEAELMGKLTHGYIRVPWLVEKLKNFRHQQPIVLKTNTLKTDYDCSNSIGYLALKSICNEQALSAYAMHTIIVKNIFPTNLLGQYIKPLLKRYVVLGFGTTPRLAKTNLNKKNILGTNPLIIGIESSSSNKIICDLSTTPITFGDILLAKEGIGNIPDGKLLSESGQTVSHANETFNEGRFTGGINIDLQDRLGAKLFALQLTIDLVTSFFASETKDTNSLVLVLFNKEKFGDSALLESIFEDRRRLINPLRFPGSKHGPRKNEKEISISKKLYKEISLLNSPRNKGDR